MPILVARSLPGERSGGRLQWDDAPVPRTLLAVFAHPDDDAHGIAGTVALHADDPEFRFVLVLATDGGAGDIREGFPATRETLGAIRQAEDAAAWQALGRVPDRHVWLGYADGEVDRVPCRRHGVDQWTPSRRRLSGVLG